MTRYVFRTVAVLYVIGLLALTTSWIGEPSSCKPVSWEAAWFFSLLLANSVLLGVLANQEYEHEKRQFKGAP